MSNQPAIRRFTTPGMGSVNTFWIEGVDGVVVIDGQRELSKARRARAEIDAGGKPIVAVILTHPHPDHFGGLGIFAPPGSGVPVYGSEQARDSIAEDRFGLVKASHETVGDDFPDEVTLPDRFLSDGDVIRVAGLEIFTREWGEGEAECMTILHVPAASALFCADVIQDRMTAFLLEGRSTAWLQQLERLRTEYADVETVYPGHGDPGSPSALIERQIEYLTHFRRAVMAATVDGELPPGGDQRVADAVNSRYPGYLPVAAIPDLLKMDTAPVAEELAKALRQSAPMGGRS